MKKLYHNLILHESNGKEGQSQGPHIIKTKTCKENHVQPGAGENST